MSHWTGKCEGGIETNPEILTELALHDAITKCLDEVGHGHGRTKT